MGIEDQPKNWMPDIDPFEDPRSAFGIAAERELMNELSLKAAPFKGGYRTETKAMAKDNLKDRRSIESGQIEIEMPENVAIIISENK